MKAIGVLLISLFSFYCKDYQDNNYDSILERVSQYTKNHPHLVRRIDPLQNISSPLPNVIDDSQIF